MSNPYWSIYKNNHLDEELAAEFPDAVCHDKTNTVFVAVPEDTTGAFFVPEIGEDGDPLPLKHLIVIVGRFLASQTDKPLIARKEQLVQLFNTPHHRLWCGNYDNWEPLQSDYIAVFGVDNIDGRKPIDELNKQARTDILKLIRG